MRVQQLVPEHVARFIGYVELAGLEDCGLDREAVFWRAGSLGESRHMSRSPPATGRAAMGPPLGPGRLWGSGLLVLQRESVFFAPLACGVVPSHGTSSGTGRSARNASAIWSLWGILSAMAAVPTGIYARLAGGAGGQWDPESALGAVGARHTARWRREYGLQNDADFAFAFRSFEEALTTGGRDLANSCVAPRSPSCCRLRLMWWRV